MEKEPIEISVDTLEFFVKQGFSLVREINKIESMSETDLKKKPHLKRKLKDLKESAKVILKKRGRE